jgi:pimeloyl-ACP methyl ester carboxylesterase
MHVAVNGTTLFFDVDGAKLVPDGRTLREKPTLIVLHSGPGHDHSIFKTGFSQLTDIAQIIYLDHRGNGRSVGSGKGSWNLNQWGDDVKGLCDALGITRRIVYGASFGGFMAQAYATRFRNISHAWAWRLHSQARTLVDLLQETSPTGSGLRVMSSVPRHASMPSDPDRFTISGAETALLIPHQGARSAAGLHQLVEAVLKVAQLYER